MVKYTRIALLVIMDVLIINFAYIFWLLMRFDFDVSSIAFNSYFAVYVNNMFLITLTSVLGLALAGIYTSMWKYAGADELVKVAVGSLLSVVFSMSAMSLMQQSLPRSTYIAAFMIIMIGVGGVRMLYRYLRRLRNPGAAKLGTLQITRGGIIGSNTRKVMMVGAGDAGASMIKEIKDHPEYGQRVVVAIDDNPEKIGRRIAGVKVAGDTTQIKTIARKYSVDDIIVAIPSANKKTIQRIVTECNKTRCKIKILPSLIDLINEKVSISKLRDVDIEDLLGRDPVEVNIREVSGYLEGKIVLVSGAGGSIGSELCRQIARFKPRRLIALDIYENSVFELAGEMKRLYPALEFETVIASVRSRERLSEVFSKYRPHIVFHAAAHKHVPLMEKNPGEALLNNILGTKNIMDISEQFVAERFVMISTDKAVNPTNVMGATKRAAEMILQEKSKHSQTNFVAVRFGNVLGSNGSVIPIFRKQIEEGGPVTVTHPDITRYFMTIPEAVQLVIQAGAMAEGGEIFILDMGEPVKIMDLAENVIRLSGYVPGVDIDIVITGLRPGEKLYEELLLNEEGLEKTAHNKIYVGHPLGAEPKLREMLENDTLEATVRDVAKKSDDEIKEWLKGIVTNYTPQ